MIDLNAALRNLSERAGLIATMRAMEQTEYEIDWASHHEQRINQISPLVWR